MPSSNCGDLTNDSRRRPVLWSFLAGLLAFLALLVTAPTLPMSWDEGNAIDRAAGISEWAREARATGTVAFSSARIARQWHYTVEIEGHPDLYGIVIAGGQALAAGRLHPLSAARLGPMMLFGFVGLGYAGYRQAKRASFQSV